MGSAPSMDWTVAQGDNLPLLRGLPDCSVDAIVCDPPYELGFMGKAWDARGVAYDVTRWREMLRVLKPGGHLIAFGGTRTYHRMTCAIEDAGFEVRDCLGWLYGSGFPKSLDVGKAIDKAAGAEREVLERRAVRVGFDTECQGGGGWSAGEVLITAPATDAAKQWQGWGTALKPAFEPALLARKPLAGTVAENVQRWGVGALNIDGCRVGVEQRFNSAARNTGREAVPLAPTINADYQGRTVVGRWPANIAHDGSAEVLAVFPSTGPSSSPRNNAPRTGYAMGTGKAHVAHGHDDEGGSAARFFYSAKASRSEREQGLGKSTSGDRANIHATVKPIELMRWLCRLVTPPGGLVLDPYCGSGSTGIAAVLEGFAFLGFELDPAHAYIARRRIGAVARGDVAQERR